MIEVLLNTITLQNKKRSC